MNDRSNSNTRSFRWLRLAIILLLYLALSFYQIDLPGLHYDEAFEAVPALQLLQGRPVTAFRNSGLVIDGQTYPIMTQDYIGALNTYLALPFIHFLGPTPAALRTLSILVGAMTLGLTYALVRRLTGSEKVGLAAALLLAVDPTFIFWNRQGVFVTAITAPLGLAAALCWGRWLRSKAVVWAVAGAFLFGLGLYAKFLFLWLIVALVGAYALLYLLSAWLAHPLPPEWRPARPQLTTGLMVLAAFLLGCWPLIVYNIQTAGTFLSISENAATSYYGVNNLAFGPNLLERLYQFWVVLGGGHFWYLGATTGNPLAPVTFISIFGLVCVVSIYISTRKRKGALTVPLAPATFIALFPFLVIILVIIASIGTVSALWLTHFALLMPWPVIAIAVGGWFILLVWPHIFPGNQSRRRIQRLASILWAILVISHLATTARYHLALAESGGLSSHSDAIYELSAWLDRHADGPVVAMDWGLAAPVTYLTGGRVRPVEVFGYAWEADVKLAGQLEPFMAQPATLYLWRSPEEIIYDRSDEFKAHYRPLHLEENIEEAFYERSGRPILGVTRLVPAGSAVNPPQ